VLFPITQLLPFIAVDLELHLLQAIGVELDLADKGLGIRSRRYAMLLDDGSVSITTRV